MAVVHLRAVMLAYGGLLPTATPPPTLEGLAREWEADLLRPEVAIVVAEARPGIVGTAIAQRDERARNWGQLRRLNVEPTCWGQGFGTALHDHALRALDEMGYSRAGLWVLEKNLRARRLYERRGWLLVSGETITYLGATEVRYARACRRVGEVPGRPPSEAWT